MQQLFLLIKYWGRWITPNFDYPFWYILYTAKNATDVNFTGLLQLVNKLQQTCQFHQVATSLLKSGLLELVICRLVTTSWNYLQQACWTEVLTINLQQVCWQLAIGLSSTSCRKPCERILISACFNMSVARYLYRVYQKNGNRTLACYRAFNI